MRKLRALLISPLIRCAFLDICAFARQNRRPTLRLDRCDKTVWFHVIQSTFASFFAQAVITLRFVTTSSLSHGPLTSHLGCMPSRGTTGGSPPTFLFVVWCSLLSGCILRPILDCDPVCPFLPGFEGNARGGSQFQRRWYF